MNTVQSEILPPFEKIDAPSCHGGLENLDEEFDYWIEDIEGEIPANLQGTFFRNGPGDRH